MENKQKIVDAYIDYVSVYEQSPKSIYSFMKDLGLSEAHFYEHFSSFRHLESQIWADIFQNATQKISKEEVYANYSVREKILGLYFTLLEDLKAYRSFARFTLQPNKKTWRNPLENLHSLEDKFEAWVSHLVGEGIQNGEIEDRTLLTERYVKVLWWQMLFIIRFWLKDQSPNFEKTDAAVEKSVNLALDLLGKNVGDTAFDFIKFLFQKP